MRGRTFSKHATKSIDRRSALDQPAPSCRPPRRPWVPSRHSVCAAAAAMVPTAPAARLATRRALLCTDLCCFGCAPEAHLPTAHAPCEREAHAHAQSRPLSCSGRCCTRAILVTSGVAWARRARAHAHTDLDVTARSRSRLPPRQMTHDPHVLARSSLPSRHPPRCYRRHRPCEPIRRRGNGQWFAETSHESIRPRCTVARTHARRRRRCRGS